MSSKNIYVSDADEAIWYQAQELAKCEGIGLSKLITRALQRYVPNDIHISNVSTTNLPELLKTKPVLERGRNSITNQSGWHLHYTLKRRHKTFFFLGDNPIPLEAAREHLREIFGQW